MSLSKILRIGVKGLTARTAVIALSPILSYCSPSKAQLESEVLAAIPTLDPLLADRLLEEEEPEEPEEPCCCLKEFPEYVDPCYNTLSNGVDADQLKTCTLLADTSCDDSTKFLVPTAISAVMFAYYFGSLKNWYMERRETKVIQKLPYKCKIALITSLVLFGTAYVWKTKAPDQMYYCPGEKSFVYRNTSPTNLVTGGHSYTAVPAFTVKRMAAKPIHWLKSKVCNMPPGYSPFLFQGIMIGRHEKGLSESMKSLLHSPGEEDVQMEGDCFLRQDSDADSQRSKF